MTGPSRRTISKVVRVKWSWGALVVALSIAAASAVVSFRSVYEPDLGWHLAQGRENLSGRLVRTNVFSFTYAGYRQHYTSWLSDTSAYAAWRFGGDAAIQALEAGTVAATLLFVYLACRLQSGALPSAAVLILGFFVLEPRVIPRPHLASFAGIAAGSWLIERARVRRSARPLLWSIPMFALWSNLHSECIFGVLLIGLFALAEFVRPSALARRDAVRALAIAAGCAAALLVNPYGWGLLAYVYENASVPQILSIAELRPAYLPAYRAFFVYVAIAVLLLLSLPRRLTLSEALACLVFAALGFRYLRLTPLAFLAMAPMLASRLTAWTARGLDGRALLATALAGAVFVSRVPLTTLAGGVRIGGAHPDVVFSAQALAFARAEGLEGPSSTATTSAGGWPGRCTRRCACSRTAASRRIPRSTFAPSSRRRDRNRRGTRSCPASTGPFCPCRGRTRCPAPVAFRRRPGPPCMRTTPWRFWSGAAVDTATWPPQPNVSLCDPGPADPGPRAQIGE